MNPLINILDHVHKVTTLSECNDLIDHWADKTDMDNGIIITLNYGRSFNENRHENVRGFDTPEEAVHAVHHSYPCNCDECIKRS